MTTSEPALLAVTAVVVSGVGLGCGPPAELALGASDEAGDDDWPAATTLMSELRFSNGEVVGLALANGAPLSSILGLEVARPCDVGFVSTSSDLVGCVWPFAGSALLSDSTGGTDDVIADVFTWPSVLDSKIDGFSELVVSWNTDTTTVALDEEDKAASVLVECEVTAKGSARIEDLEGPSELEGVLDVFVVTGSLM
jgi:hypothetical protein